LVGMALEALRLMRTEGWRRERLWQNAHLLRKGLQALGFDTLRSETPIIPVLVGEDRLVMEFSRRLLERGVYVQGIRPPTVPEGSARLRLSVSAVHSRDELELALEAMGQIGRELGLI